MAKNRITFTDDFVLRNEKVGIGTTDPDATLTATGTVRFGGTTTSPNFYVAETGYVGFGTTNPTNGVEFKDSVRFSAIGATSTENINFIPYTEQSGALSVENSNYDTQHLSVTNETSNILFQVNGTNADPYLQVINSGVTSIRDGEFRSLKGVALGSTESEKISLSPYTEEGGSLSFENASYDNQHFSVTNTPSNILFAINDENADSVFEVTNTGVTTFTDGNFRKFSGVAVGATASEIVTMLPYTEESGSLSFENINGEYQHLSLTNETGGDIFAVNDDDAEPVLQVSNSGVVHSGITTIGLTTTATAPTVNATMSFELTNNTTLTVRVKGTDGTVRTGIVTLS
jgi:hypothetical protein